MKSLILPALIAILPAALSAETLPPEALELKAAFEETVEQLNAGGFEKLNEAYARNLDAAKTRAQEAGDLNAVLELTQELESIRETGDPDSSLTVKNPALNQLRQTYKTAHAQIAREKVAKFEAERTAYAASLANVVAELTKQGRIEEAIATRQFALTVPNIALSSLSNRQVVDAKSSLPISQWPAGRLRGFGRLSGMNAGEQFDLAPLQRFEDYVDIAGNNQHLYFLRSNGDVLNIKGEVVGSRASKLLPFGYLDEKGMLHYLHGLKKYPIDEPLKNVFYNGTRLFGQTQSGKLIGVGGSYDDGERSIPDRARYGIREIGSAREWDIVLTKSGEIIRWSHKGDVAVVDKFRSNIDRVITKVGSIYVITNDNDIFWLDGKVPKWWSEKAKDVKQRGQMSAFQDMDDAWHVFIHANPIGKEPEAISEVLNRGDSTIKAEFWLHRGNRAETDKGRSSYAVWIEEVTAPEIDLTKLNSSDGTEDTPGKPKVTFFGIELE